MFAAEHERRLLCLERETAMLYTDIPSCVDITALETAVLEDWKGCSRDLKRLYGVFPAYRCVQKLHAYTVYGGSHWMPFV